MQKKPRQTTIREDMAALRASHEALKDALVQRLDAIVERLDLINGSVRKHQSWIDGREPVCLAQQETLRSLADVTKDLTDQHAEDRGAQKARGRASTAINAVISALIGLAGVWVGLRVHP